MCKHIVTGAAEGQPDVVITVASYEEALYTQEVMQLMYHDFFVWIEELDCSPHPS